MKRAIAISTLMCAVLLAGCSELSLNENWRACDFELRKSMGAFISQADQKTKGEFIQACMQTKGYEFISEHETCTRSTFGQQAGYCYRSNSWFSQLMRWALN